MLESEMDANLGDEKEFRDRQVVIHAMAAIRRKSGLNMEKLSYPSDNAVK